MNDTQPNTLGNASLRIGIAAAAVVFGIALCALVGLQQGWLVPLPGTILFVCGATTAFVAFIGLVVGAGGLFGSGRSKATAVIGVVLNIIGICVFIGAMAAIRGG